MCRLDIEFRAFVIPDGKGRQFVRKSVDCDAGSCQAVLPEPFIDHDKAEILADGVRDMKPDFMRCEYDIRSLGRCLLPLESALRIERADDRLLPFPAFSAGGCLDIEADL